MPSLDIIAVGELLVDMITTDYVDNLGQARQFEWHPGGSPANLASNMVRLGRSAALVATVGDDGMGQLLHEQMSDLGLEVGGLRLHRQQPTSLILVTRSHNLPAFTAYRQADAQIVAEQLQYERLAQTRILHTTAFALSREPARRTILRAAEQAEQLGVQLSIDANYAYPIWPDRDEARQTLERYLGMGALAKFSDVDYQRLYQRPVDDPERVGQQLIALGAGLVCLTLGHKGAYLFLADGQQLFLPARAVDVVDTTGAGDAFWAGFLHAWLAGGSPLGWLESGRALAEMKLTKAGPLPARVKLAGKEDK